MQISRTQSADVGAYSRLLYVTRVHQVVPPGFAPVTTDRESYIRAIQSASVSHDPLQTTKVLLLNCGGIGECHATACASPIIKPAHMHCIVAYGFNTQSRLSRSTSCLKSTNNPFITHLQSFWTWLSQHRWYSSYICLYMSLRQYVLKRALWC